MSLWCYRSVQWGILRATPRGASSSWTRTSRCPPAHLLQLSFASHLHIPGSLCLCSLACRATCGLCAAGLLCAALPVSLLQFKTCMCCKTAPHKHNDCVCIAVLRSGSSPHLLFITAHIVGHVVIPKYCIGCRSRGPGQRR